MKQIYYAFLVRGESKEDAFDMTEEIRERLNQGEDPIEVLYDYGLEPDYYY